MPALLETIIYYYSFKIFCCEFEMSLAGAVAFATLYICVCAGSFLGGCERRGTSCKMARVGIISNRPHGSRERGCNSISSLSEGRANAADLFKRLSAPQSSQEDEGSRRAVGKSAALL